MKTLKIGGLAFLALIIAVLGIRFLSGSEDTWLCQNGEWIKHGNPNAPQPTTVCGDRKKSDEVLVTKPQLNQVISSPLTVEGQAKGNWFFEASFPIELVDDQGTILGQSHVQAQSDWMTDGFVPFKGEMNYQVTATTTGKLILKNDNLSGLPQNNKRIEMPVLISPSPTMTIKVFFSNNKLDKEITCNRVFSVERQVAKTVAVAGQVLAELLKGPSAEDKANGYYTSINPGVTLQKLTINQGTARVDFDQTLEKAVGGSCRVSAIRAQLVQTLKQFSTIKDVIISINGRTEDILQP